jgi:hypothetical protein
MSAVIVFCSIEQDASKMSEKMIKKYLFKSRSFNRLYKRKNQIFNIIIVQNIYFYL